MDKMIGYEPIAVGSIPATPTKQRFMLYTYGIQLTFKRYVLS